MKKVSQVKEVRMAEVGQIFIVFFFFFDLDIYYFFQNIYTQGIQMISASFDLNMSS